MNHATELAEAAKRLEAVLEHPRPAHWHATEYHEARHSLWTLAAQILAEPERDASETVREMRLAAEDGTDPVSLDPNDVNRWADALECAEAQRDLADAQRKALPRTDKAMFDECYKELKQARAHVAELEAEVKGMREDAGL